MVQTKPQRKDEYPKNPKNFRIELMKTAMLINFVFVLSLVPFWSLTIIGRYCKSCKQEKWYIASYRFSIPILYSNSAFNPILYAWRMQPYRRSKVSFVFRHRVVKRRSFFCPTPCRYKTVN